MVLKFSLKHVVWKTGVQIPPKMTIVTPRSKVQFLHRSVVFWLGEEKASEHLDFSLHRVQTVLIKTLKYGFGGVPHDAVLIGKFELQKLSERKYLHLVLLRVHKIEQTSGGAAEAFSGHVVESCVFWKVLSEVPFVLMRIHELDIVSREDSEVSKPGSVGEELKSLFKRPS